MPLKIVKMSSIGKALFWNLLSFWIIWSLLHLFLESHSVFQLKSAKPVDLILGTSQPHPTDSNWWHKSSQKSSTFWFVDLASMHPCMKLSGQWDRKGNVSDLFIYRLSSLWRLASYIPPTSAGRKEFGVGSVSAKRHTNMPVFFRRIWFCLMWVYHFSFSLLFRILKRVRVVKALGDFMCLSVRDLCKQQALTLHSSALQPGSMAWVMHHPLELCSRVSGGFG